MNHVHQFIPDIKFGKVSLCTYCGGEAETIDHVVPVAFYGIKRKYLTSETGVRTYACRSCNSSLGSRVFTTFKARLQHIASVHTKKAKQTKSAWSDRELAELDHTLQTFVRAKKNVSNTNHNKTKWIDSPAFCRTIANLQDFKELQHHEPCHIEWLSRFFKDYFKEIQ